MLLNRWTLDGIAAGRITLVFRRWRRPSVRGGSTLLTGIGLLAIEDVEPVAEIGEDDARAAGHDTRESLLAALSSHEGQLYRIRLRLAGADPRIALRAEADLGEPELHDMETRLMRLDARRAWTRATLALIAAHPARRARELAALLGRETLPFKQDVRKLKALGLTESLTSGYRLSPRGEAVLQRLSSR